MIFLDLYHQGQLQFKELFPSRGFQASSEPILHFGLAKQEQIDSLKVVWPDKTYQILTNVPANQTLIISPKNIRESFQYNSNINKSRPIFEKDTSLLGIQFAHIEDNYLDFNREKLIPYRISDRGPAYAKGDLNNDGLDDLFFGGSKYTPSKTFIQSHSGFDALLYDELAQDSIKENIAAEILDFDNDGNNDIIIGNGGGDFFGSSEKLADNLFKGSANAFLATEFPEIFQNTSVIKPFDIDNDGDLDIFIGGQTKTGKFGEEIPSYLLINQKGQFEISKNFELNGMVTDAIWDDFDQDGTKDLIVIGEWMAPRLLKNSSGTLVESVKIKTTGLWQSIHPFDIDHDGDTDYLIGNWGLNSKFKASEKYPLRLYVADFDSNGQTETITAFAKNGTYYPLEGLDGLASQMVSLRKKFTSYTSFAGKSIEDIFEADQLKNAKILEVNTLASGYLKNNEGSFEFVPFSNELQTAPIMDFVSLNIGADEKIEVLAAGNYFGVKPYHGRFDSFPGALISSENEVVLGNQLGLDLTQKSVRHLDVLTLNKQNYLLAVFNDSNVAVYKINSKSSTK